MMLPLPLCISALLATAAAQTIASGYQYTSDSDVANTIALGAKLADVDAALNDFAAAKAIFDTGLDTVAQTHASSSLERAKFEAYDRSGQIGHSTLNSPASYASNFAMMALMDNFNGNSMLTLPEVAAATLDQRGGPAGIANKSREELVMKGLALQSVLMGSINHLYKANASCHAGSGPVKYVDQAWALFAAPKGPIALGEKRCPQFATCEADNSGAGLSAVNTKVLAGFKAAQTAATAGDCAALLTQITEQIVPQVFVPILQGLFREAWEVDDAMSHVHGGADGFVEVVEGWAFASGERNNQRSSRPPSPPPVTFLFVALPVRIWLSCGLLVSLLAQLCSHALRRVMRKWPQLW